MDVESEVIWLRFLVQVHREQELLQDQHPHFDRWYRARINVAHARYMERTSYHLRCDWRVFTPQTIAGFVDRYR